VTEYEERGDMESIPSQYINSLEGLGKSKAILVTGLEGL
jgi:hypothetical protein